MTSNKKKKNENRPAGPAEKKPQEATSQNEKPDSGEKPEGFDFGGLPQRDLKKNLGCG